MGNEITFESGMQQLEELTSKLERGDMTLEESFTAYEHAMKLKKELERLLDDGEAKIRTLTEDGEKLTDLEDFE